MVSSGNLKTAMQIGVEDPRALRCLPLPVRLRYAEHAQWVAAALASSSRSIDRDGRGSAGVYLSAISLRLRGCVVAVELLICASAVCKLLSSLLWSAAGRAAIWRGLLVLLGSALRRQQPIGLARPGRSSGRVAGWVPRSFRGPGCLSNSLTCISVASKSTREATSMGE